MWPTINDHGAHGGYCPRGKNFQNVNPVRGRKSKGGKEFVVKIFVGVEYECPRGHRFMASAPDKVLKATGSGIVKDSGNKVTSSTADMPLYFPCPCRFVTRYALSTIEIIRLLKKTGNESKLTNHSRFSLRSMNNRL